jgi:hypothetical protein
VQSSLRDPPLQTSGDYGSDHCHLLCFEYFNLRRFWSQDRNRHPRGGQVVHNSNIAIVINDFHDVVSSLGRHPLGTSAHELALKELATKCQQVSQKLIELLDSLKTSPDSSTWRGMKITLRSMRKNGEVVNLESQLDKYRSEIMTRLLLILK